MSAPKLTTHSAVLLVKDVIASAEHYRDKLGFHYDGLYAENTFCILHRDGCYLMLKQANDPKHVIPPVDRFR